MNSLEDINDLEQTAAYLKITPAALRRLVQQQKIGCLKQGRALTFPRAVIETYISGNTVEAKPANPWGLTDASLRRVRGRQF